MLSSSKKPSQIVIYFFEIFSQPNKQRAANSPQPTDSKPAALSAVKKWTKLSALSTKREATSATLRRKPKESPLTSSTRSAAGSLVPPQTSASAFASTSCEKSRLSGAPSPPSRVSGPTSEPSTHPAASHGWDEKPTPLSAARAWRPAKAPEAMRGAAYRGAPKPWIVA